MTARKPTSTVESARAKWGSVFHDVRLSPQARADLRALLAVARERGTGAIPCDVTVAMRGDIAGRAHTAGGMVAIALACLRSKLEET